MRYWVVRRTKHDQDDRGWYKRMEICAGPFATRDEAEEETRRRTEEHQRFLHDENVDKDIRKKAALDFVNYWSMSDDDIEEGRRRGIDIR